METVATPVELLRNISSSSLPLTLREIPSITLSKSSCSSIQSSEALCFISCTDQPHAALTHTYITNEEHKVIKIAHIHTRPSDQQYEMLPLQDNTPQRLSLVVHHSTDSQINEVMNIMTMLQFGDITKGNTQQSKNEIECLTKNGYARKDKMCNLLQGELFMAQMMDGKNVTIKKIHKDLYYHQLTIDGVRNQHIEESIVKEAVILRHLTVSNRATNGCIVKFVQFFESDDAFYLVTEHAGTLTLADFNKKAHELIAKRKLKTKLWKQIVKYLFWQISVIMNWLHNDMNCCHLDLCLQNIMVINGDFIQDKQGNMSFDPNISIKLAEFGLSEVFLHDDYSTFKCSKYGERKRHHLSAPNVFAEEVYDARKADVWSLGIALYELATGLEPYRAQDVIGIKKVTQPNTLDNLMELITLNEKTKYVNRAMVMLMTDLLNIEEGKRINVDDILHNEWMSLYYKRYKTQIEKKAEFQLLRNKQLIKKMDKFPFYNA